MPRAIWSGAIAFGLVHIPVELFPATQDTRHHFHQLHKKDLARIQYSRVCSAEGTVVPAEEIVKGYETGHDEYVIVTAAELDALEPEASRLIEISDFVEIAEVDPLYWDRPYYLAPGRNAARAYHLLREAMTETGKVGIARFVMRQREYLATIRPVEEGLALITMRYAEELRPISDLGGVAAETETPAKELKIAVQLINSLTAPFDPEQYENTYEQKVEALIQARAAGQEKVSKAPVSRKAGKITDLATALKESLEAARKLKPGARTLAAAKKAPARTTAKPKAKPVAKKPAAKKTAAARKKS